MIFWNELDNSYISSLANYIIDKFGQYITADDSQLKISKSQEDSISFARRIRDLFQFFEKDEEIIKNINELKCILYAIPSMECLNQPEILYENIQNNTECFMILKDSLKNEDFKYIPKLLDELKNDYEANKNRNDFLIPKIEYALPNTQLVNEIKKVMPNCNDEDIPKEVLKNNVFTRENLQGD